MYIIIAGAGVIGSNIASLLAEEGHDVAVIEQSEEVLEKVRRQLDVKAILGSAATPKALREAEVQRADLIVAVTNSDETNMLACFLAKEAGVGMAAARVRNPEYLGYFITPSELPSAPRRVIRMKSLGVDIFINPEFEAAKEITNMLSGLYSTPVQNFANGRVQIREFKVEGEAVVNKPLGEITFPKPCVVTLLIRAGGIIMPSANEVIKQGDYIYLVAPRECMDELGEMFTQPQRPAKSVVIYGGGYPGFLVAERLQKRGVSVKIIDENIRRCEEIAAKLEQVTVLQGDGTDRDFLIEEGVPSADAFVAITENDEINILCGLLAKSLGVPRSLVLVNKPGYIPLAEAVGVNVAASPFLLTARKIAHFVLHGGAISAAFIGGNQIQAIEFVTQSTAHIVHRKIAEAGLPKEAIAGAIIHDDTVIIPPNNSVVQPGDHVIIISALSVIPAVEKLFK